MLMQPNQVITPPPQPQPNSPFEFMMKDEQKGRKFGLPSGAPKPLLILVGLIAVTFVALILGSVLKGGGASNSTQIVDLMAQNQEIIRVSTVNQQNFKDPNNLALSTTTVVTLTSQETQFSAYLAKVKAKYTPAQLGSLTNKNTDAALQSAVLNNGFDGAYLAYLKSAVQKYQDSIDATSKTSTKNFNQILQSAFSSNKTLLASPQLATAN